MHQLPMKSCSPCISVTRMRDGDKGSVSGEHAAEQTLPFAPDRASGFGKTGKTHPHPQLIQYPITAAHQSQERLPVGLQAPGITNLHCHHL